MFIHIGHSGSDVRAEAEEVGRLVSLCLRGGLPLKEIVNQLKDIKGADPVWWNGRQVTGIGDAVAKVLEKYVRGEAT